MHISVWTATADMILKSHPVAGVGVDESTGSALAPRAADEKGLGKECCSTSNGICVALPSASNGRALPQVAAEQPSSLRPLCASAPCPPNLRGGGKTIDERINTLLHVLDEFQEAGEAASAHPGPPLTTWFSTLLPRHLAPLFDALATCARQSPSNFATPPLCMHVAHTDAALNPAAVKSGIFRTDLSLRAFSRLFYLDQRDVRANRTERWGRFLRAARNGRLLERPNTPPLWQPHKEYHEPMWDKLQSSYADVEHELRVMCGREPPPKPPGQFRGYKILFVAGDGLALMRMNHLLANKCDVFINQTPVVIPIQGA